MENVINSLKHFAQNCDLHDRYKPEFALNEDIKIPGAVQLNNIDNNYKKQVELKRILHEKYKENGQQYDLDFWIINNWGGISSFKRNQRNKNKIKKFKEDLTKGKLTKDNFSTISSLSKISSFMNPNEFAIYDSRVIYALNWLILTRENQNGFKQKYFPMPNGRNKKLSDFNMNTILQIVYVDDYNENQDISQKYIEHKSCYFEYCDFIKSAAKQVYGENGKPYELEMLLFTIADQEIFNEVKNNLKITII